MAKATQDDIIEARYSRNVKAGPYGTSGFNNTLHVMRPGDKAVVLEVVPSGNAYWIKIGY